MMQCEECDQHFSSDYSLKRHKRRHHAEVSCDKTEGHKESEQETEQE